MPIAGCACQSCVRSETYSPGRCGSFSKIRFVPLPFPWAPSNGRGRYALPPAGQKLFWPALSKRRFFLALEALLRCSRPAAHLRGASVSEGCLDALRAVRAPLRVQPGARLLPGAFGCQHLPLRAVLLGGLRERPSVFFPAHRAHPPACAGKESQRSRFTPAPFAAWGSFCAPASALRNMYCKNIMRHRHAAVVLYKAADTVHAVA